MAFNVFNKELLDKISQAATSAGLTPDTGPKTIEVMTNSPFSASATAYPQTPPKLAADLVITPVPASAPAQSSSAAPATVSSALYQQYLNNLSASNNRNVVSNYKQPTYARYVAPTPNPLPVYRTDLTNLLRKFQPRRFAEGGEANEYESESRRMLDNQRGMDELLRRGNQMLAENQIPAGLVRSADQGINIRAYSPTASQVRPYAEYSPAAGRVTEVGAEYAGGRPGQAQYGARLSYSPDARVPVAQGRFSMPLSKSSEISAGGMYMPLPGRDAYAGDIRYTKRFADGGEATDDQVTRNMNDAIAAMLEQYKAGKVGPEQLAAVTGLSVDAITSMFSSSDTSLVNPPEKLGEYRPSGPTVMTDENKRIRPDYELRSVPRDMTSPNARMPMEEYIRRKQMQRSGVNPRTQMFADGGEAMAEEPLPTDQGPEDMNAFLRRGKSKPAPAPELTAAGLQPYVRIGVDQAKLDPYTQEELIRSGAYSVTPFPDDKYGYQPYTFSTIPGARPMVLPSAPRDTMGFILDKQGAKPGELSDVAFIGPRTSVRPKEYNATLAHEAEHLLARRALGSPGEIAPMFEKLSGGADPKRFVFDALGVSGYLDKKYGIKGPYFDVMDPETRRFMEGDPSRLFVEQLAEMSAIETMTGKDLTKDPVLREKLFKDPKVRQAYNAITGLRQTRLDAKDIPPYTVVSEETGQWEKPGQEQGILDWIKSKVRRRADGSPESGEVSPEDPFFGDAMMQSTVGTIPADRSIEEPSMARKGLDMLKQAGQTAYGNVKEAITDPVAFNKRALGNLAKQLQENPEEFMMNFTGGGLGGVIKPRGGNWSKQAVEDALGSMRQRLDRYVSVDIPGLEKFGAVTKTTPAEYAQALEKGLSDLEAGVDPMKVFSQTIHSDAEGILRGTPKEDLGPYVKRRITDELNDLVRPRVALDDWIQKNLGRYVTRDMATPEDPVRKMIDQNMAVAAERLAIGQRQIAKLEADIAKAKAAGKNTDVSEARLADLKFETQDAYDRALEAPLPGGVPSADFLWGIDEKISRRRIEGGFPEEGLGKSEAAKQYEKWADSVIDPINNPREFGAENPLIKNSFSPEEIERIMQGNQPVYELRDSMILYEKPFQHLIDELKNATGTGSGLPKELQLTAADLQQMGIEKAFRHVQRIDDWRYAQKSQASLEKAGRSVEVVKSYPDSPKSLRWVEIKKVGEGTEAEQKLADALKYEGSTMGHCVGGYCPDVLAGKSRIYSLRDARGEPHVTIEAAPSEMFTSDIYSFMVENPNLMDRLGINPEDYHYVANKASYFDQNEFTKKLVKTPEYQEWLASRPMELLQIKGKGNMKPNKEYIPFVQDFVQQSVWTRLGDIENADFVPLNDRMFDSLRSRDIRFNYSFLDEGSVPYVTKEEFSRLQDVLRGSE